VRAKIEKLDNKTLVIREIPFTKTASSLQESITKAVEKGKLKIRKVEDMTAREVEIQLHLAPGVSSDKTIDALYAFTDCEINIAPNCCVIEDNKPQFLTVSDVLRHSVDRTKGLLKRELEIRKGELEEQLFYASLEQIFIEERIYKGKPFENAKNTDELCEYIDERLTPFYPQFIREVRKEDILRLLEIKMQRIAKFNKDKNEELIARIKDEIAGIEKDLSEMTRVTIEWFEFLQKKYGKDHPRRTEIKSFDTIIAAKVAEKNEKLYVDRKEGFIGYGLKKAEFVQNCSDLDDVVVFYKDGKYKVIKIQDKIFVGKNILHVQVFKKGDKRTIYNVVYRDGKTGPYYIKRFNITSITRDREYDLTLGTPGSKIMYFSANPNGEAEVIKITLNPNPKKKKQNIFLDKDFSEIKIKGREAKGNLLTREGIHRISLKSHGHSTLGGRKVWFDPDVLRINFDSHGDFLGEFNDGDLILVVLKNGEYYFTNFDPNNHYDGDILRIEKFDSKKVWTAVVIDADNQNYPYLKRFYMEESKKKQSFVGENPDSKLVLLTDDVYPRIDVVYGGADSARGHEEIDCEQFVGVKGFKAKGKRITTYNVDHIDELEPTRFPEEPEETPKNPSTDDDNDDSDGETENLDPDAGKSQQQVIDEITGQLELFPDDDSE
jgi:topoisomerase-4 subunit A